MSTADTDTVDILERIRDLEEQIAGQQVSELMLIIEIAPTSVFTIETL